MKVLFVGLKVGAGLISICKSIQNQLDKIPGVFTEYIDIYSENKKMAKFSSEFYYKLVKYFPRTVALGQKIGYKRSLRTKQGHYYLNRDVEISKKEMMKFLERYSPDIVFTPVNFVAFALDELIEEKKTNVKYVFQMPDFMVAYYTHLLKNCTYLFSSCQEVTNILLNKEVKKDIIKTVGIPIDEKFYQQYDNNKIKKELNCNIDKFILISNGGAGFANNFKIVKHFYNKIGDYGLIVVNGNNKKSKDKIDKFINKKNIKNIVNLGFVSNMNQLMYVSEIIIGKCGSSSICEASACGLKYIALNNRLFPEIKNIEFLKHRNAVIVAKSLKNIKKALNIYMKDEYKSLNLLNNFKSINVKNNLTLITENILKIKE